MWLLRHLRFAQELAADELAVVAAGCRSEYRHALARMALRADAAWLGGMAQPFGSNRNTVTRRLAMLVAKEGARGPLSRAARASVIGLMLAIGIAASAVRSTAEPPATEAPTPALPAFDLGYLHGGCQGFVAIRPGLLLSRPDMKPIHDSISKSLHALLHGIGVPADRTIPLNEIEQVIGPVELKTLTEAERKKHPSGERFSLSMGITFVRMSRDYDWAGLLRSLPKLMRVTEKKPGVFEMAMPLFGPDPITLRVLDSRTIVGSSASEWEASENRIEITERFSARMIETANQAGMAVVIDNKRAQFTEAVRSRSEVAPLAAALDNPARLAICFHWADRAKASAFLQWDKPNTARERGEAITRDTMAAWHALGKALQESATASSDKKRALVIARSLIAVGAGGPKDEGHAEVKFQAGWPEIIGMMMEGATASVEAVETKSPKD
jgi:hypothetical protein